MVFEQDLLLDHMLAPGDVPGPFQQNILSDREKISSFIEEIESEDYEVSVFGDKPIKCPWCDDGYLVKRNGSPEFYGCSNY